MPPNEHESHGQSSSVRNLNAVSGSNNNVQNNSYSANTTTTNHYYGLKWPILAVMKALLRQLRPYTKPVLGLIGMLGLSIVSWTHMVVVPREQAPATPAALFRGAVFEELLGRDFPVVRASVKCAGRLEITDQAGAFSMELPRCREPVDCEVSASGYVSRVMSYSRLVDHKIYLVKAP